MNYECEKCGREKNPMVGCTGLMFCSAKHYNEFSFGISNDDYLKARFRYINENRERMKRLESLIDNSENEIRTYFRNNKSKLSRISKKKRMVDVRAGDMRMKNVDSLIKEKQLRSDSKDGDLV